MREDGAEAGAPVRARHMSMPTASTMIAPITTFWAEVGTALRLRPFCTMTMVIAPMTVLMTIAAPAGKAGPADHGGGDGRQARDPLHSWASRS